MDYAYRQFSNVLQGDERFRSMSPIAQRNYLKQQAMYAVTFDDPERERQFTQMAVDVLQGQTGATGKMQGYEFWQSTIKNAGTLGLAERLFAGKQADSTQNDRRRALDYFRAIDYMTGHDNIAEEAGAVLGTLGDIALVSVATSPLTSLAKIGVGAAARGLGMAEYRAALAAGEAASDAAFTAAKAADMGAKAARAAARAASAATAPAILRPALAFYGPIAAESLVEALPYFITSEQQRSAAGQPSASSQGILEVAKVMGINAAMDFAVGTAVTKLLGAAVKTGGQVIRKNHIYDDAFDYKSPDVPDDLRQRIAVGAASPQTTVRMTDYDADLAKNRERFFNFMRKGVADPDLDPKGRASYFAIREGMNWGEVPTQSGGTRYRSWEFDPELKPVERTFDTFADLEDHIAGRYYQRYMKMDPEAKNAAVLGGGGYLVPRGELLAKQQALLDTPDIAKADIRLATESTKVKTPWKRIVVTSSEVDALARPGSGYTVVKAQIPLDEAIIQNAKKGDFTLLRGTGSSIVRASDTPNAVFVGVSAAPEKEYANAALKAKQLVADGYFTKEGEARASILITRGFDHYIHPDGSVEFFNNRTMRLIGVPDDVLNKFSRPVGVGSVSPKVIIEESGKGVLSADKVMGNGDYATSALQNLVRKRSTPSEYHDFAKAFLTSKGINQDIRVVRVSGNVPSIEISDGTIVLHSPTVASSTFDAEKDAMMSFLSDLQVTANKLNSGKKAQPLDYWWDKVAEAPNRFTFTGFKNADAWTKAAVAKLGGKIDIQPGRITVSLRSGTRIFNSMTEATHYVAIKTLDPAAVTNDLLRQGVKLVQSPSGETIARTLRTGKFLSQGSYEEVLEKIGYVPSSLDLSYGPRMVRQTAAGFEFEFNGVTVVKNQQEAMELMSQFKDQAFLNRSMNILTSQKGTIDFTPNKTYKVYSAKYAVEKDFTDLSEARRWMEQDVLPLDELKDVADKKYLDFYIDKGSYVVVARDQTYRVQTLDQVEDIFRKYPDVESSAQNVLDDIDPAIEPSVASIVQGFNGARRQAKINKYNLPPEFEAPADRRSMSAYMSFRRFTSEMDGWVEDVSRRTKDPAVREHFLSIKEAMKRAERDHYEVARTLETAAKGSNGKILSDKSLRKIYYHLAATSEEDADKLAAIFQNRYGIKLSELGPLTQDEQTVANRFAEVLDDLSIKMHIDSRKMLFHYMPRLRDGYNSACKDGLIQQMGEARSLADYAFKGKPPKEIQFWAEHERTEELARFWVKDNPLEVILLYSAQGHKKLYINEPWKAWDRYARGTQVEKGIIDRMDNFRMQLMGSYHSPGEKVVEQFGETLFRKIARTPIGKATGLTEEAMADKGKQLLSSFLGLTYFSSMGWKPWLAIRNVISSPLVGAGGRVGLDWVFRGWDDVLARGDNYIDYLREIGVISEKPPLVNQVFSHTSKYGKFMEKSMQWFKNSDDLGRAITYRACEMKFDNAYELFKAGKITTREVFEDMAGTDIIDPVIRDSVWAKVSKPGATMEDIVQARHEFAQKLTLETQVEYGSANAPQMFQGLVGKAFGQYGTFSAGYRANLARMFKYGSIGKRAQMVSTYLAICGSLWATFDALKIKTNDFVPVMPSIFTGGPLFDVGIDVLKSVDTGYEGDQARTRLMDEVPRLLPGASQLNYLMKAKKYAEEGDHYGALLSLLSVPHID